MKMNLAYSHIKQQILLGELLPMCDISEESLQKELGISRTPVHEALKRLESEYFVHIYPKKGTVVAGITFEIVNSIYEVRALLEPYCAQKQCENPPVEDLVSIKNAFLSLSRMEGRDNITEEYISIDTQFHKLLLSSFDNIFIVKMLDTIFDHDYRIRVKATYSDKFYMNNVPDHVRIIDAILEKQPKLTRELVEIHIEKSRNEIVKALMANP